MININSHVKTWMGFSGFFGFFGMLGYIYNSSELLLLFIFFSGFGLYWEGKINSLTLTSLKYDYKKVNDQSNLISIISIAISIWASFYFTPSYQARYSILLLGIVLTISLSFIFERYFVYKNLTS
ncbi:hypothetical protein BCR24_13330 [Enterococcus ureilyticus]|uniref:DUF3796 domain-containing protein n=1 Tax=Enterococcus ureilyticus TaxID=1131292 RepID=A0A1E5HDV9_9ENTE|nr:DUF3796 domain-containing protein [Enterococcus ureilyticus]MBM7689868.1 hypothetical protein [Enterococcus ureilyticus]OEG23128.1 hypothetical protein BCR24_13330 [Enterococcus ureilyticus]